MRHRKKIKHFNRDTKARKALFKNLVRSLVEHGYIVTTEAKAKEIKRISDKIISRAKVDTVATRRLLHRFFGRRDVVNSLVDRIAPEFSDRNSGFTRIESVGLRRGDNTKLVKLSLAKVPERMGTLKNSPEAKAKATAKRKSTAKKSPVKKAPAKKAPAKKKVTSKAKPKKETK